MRRGRITTGQGNSLPGGRYISNRRLFTVANFCYRLTRLVANASNPVAFATAATVKFEPCTDMAQRVWVVGSAEVGYFSSHINKGDSSSVDPAAI